MKRILLLAAFAVLLASCGSVKHVAYFQDAESVNGAIIAAADKTTIQPADQITIVVNCATPELTSLFNLPYKAQTIGQTNKAALSSTGSSSMSGYTVDPRGYIDFPVLGALKVAGKTRDEIAMLIKNELREQGQAQYAVVTVEFMNFGFDVIGEVSSPGRYSIEKEGMTIVDALTLSGDLTLFGKRQNVMLLRKTDGKQLVYTLDLCSLDNVINSPAYYIQKDDVIYVEPTKFRKRQGTVNSNNVRSFSFWTSLVSLAATTTLLYLRLTEDN